MKKQHTRKKKLLEADQKWLRFCLLPIKEQSITHLLESEMTSLALGTRW